MTKGRAAAITSDYKRHGTTTLFAALYAVDGTVIGTRMDKHRHEEFLRFLRTIDKEVPKGLAVHLILDNYATHKHKDVVRLCCGTDRPRRPARRLLRTLGNRHGGRPHVPQIADRDTARVRGVPAGGMRK
jgi:hypothetical protein